MIRLSLVAFVLLATCPRSSVAFQAKVLSTTGGVMLHRGSQPRMARPRCELQLHDCLQTLDHSGASLLVGASIVYLGEASEVEISEYDGVPIVIAHQGQARFVVTKSPGLFVATASAQAWMEKGVLRVIARQGDCQITTLEGIAKLSGTKFSRAVQQATFTSSGANASTPNKTIALLSGQEILVPINGIPAEPNDMDEPKDQCEDRGVEVDSLQNQAADALEQERQESQQLDEQQGDNLRSAPNRNGAAASQYNVTTSSISASLIGFSSSFAGSASGGLFADANQATNQGQLGAPFPGPPPQPQGDPFPGNIHLMTNESRYALNSVELLPTESSAIFGGSSNGSVYFSIAEGMPTGQVFTDFLTASDTANVAIGIPGTSKSVVKFTQFGLPDAGIDPDAAEQNGIGITGLVGTDPPAPLVVNATPTSDDRSQLNENATFALGEFRLRPNGGPDGDSFELAIRRSDQDRLIVKDSGGDDAQDVVTPNPGNTFIDVVDPRFLPAAPTVKQPVVQAVDENTQDAQTRFSGLNSLRRAAATTVLADQLHDFARRTGQTRFVVDGRIIDISGYQKP